MPQQFISKQAVRSPMQSGMRAIVRWAVFFCCASLTFLPHVAAQQKGPAATAQPLHAGPSYTSDPAQSSNGSAVPTYPEFDVVVPLDAQQAASALDPAGWQASENGSSTTLSASRVRRFDQTGYGMSVVLALDVSGSMRGRTLDIVRSSVAKFVSDAGPQDRVAVLTFADSPRWDVPFTAESAQVRKAIQQLAVRGRETHLYDSMIAAIDGFEDSMPIRRVLLVMSDGHDEGSKHTLQDVIDTANKQKISIHTIGITRSDPKYLEMLKSTSSATGGSFAAAHSDAELDNLLRNGIATLQQTPVVTFTASSGSAGNDPLSLDITWNPQEVHATAEVKTYPLSASARMFSALRKRPILLWGIAALLFLLLLGFFLRPRRHARPAAYAGTPGVQPAAPAPNPNAAAPPRPPASPRAYTPTRIEPDPAAEASPKPRAETKVERRATRMPETFSSAEGQPIITLVVLEGDRKGERIQVVSLPFAIGAHESNALRIDDPTLSGQHMSLLLESSVLLLEDLDSTNGTYLNGNLLRGARRALSPGDEFRAGRTLFRVERPTT